MSAVKSSLEMLTKALDMEQKGIEFYNDAIKKSTNTLARKMFEMLRDEETYHIKRIQKIYSDLENKNSWNSEWKSFKIDSDEIIVFFKSIKEKHNSNFKDGSTDIDAIKTGINLEEKAITYYTEHLKNASDSIEKLFLDAMIKEEKTHRKALVDMNLYLTNPDGYFREMEKGGLDGA